MPSAAAPHGAVYHTVGSGALPIAPGLPVVVDAPRPRPVGAARRVHGRAPRRGSGGDCARQQLRDAAAVVVGTEAVATAARRLLRVRAGRLHVVPIAAAPGVRAGRGGQPDAAIAERRSTAMGSVAGAYLVYPGRYDARQDLATLLRALAALGRERPRPAEPRRTDRPWPPRVLLVGATPDDRASLARAAAREGVG